MAHYQTLLTSVPEYFGEQDFLLLFFLICALIVTYCWSVLGTKLKFALYFSAGVFLFKGFFEQLIDKRLFPNLHSYLPIVLGSITAGLLEIGAFLIANRIIIIGIFFGGAIFPLLFLAHLSLLDFTKSWLAPPLMVVAALAIFSGLAMRRITHAKPFQLVTSAICGALGIVYLTGLHSGVSNWQLLDSNGFGAIIHMMQNNRLPAAICLSISGLIVQSLLHLASGQVQR